jgi:hypothetical protein
MRARLGTWIVWSVALGLGCAGRAVDLRPGSIPSGHGAVHGRLQVFEGDVEMTATCNVTFTDEDKEQRGRFSLDYTGWISTTLKQGETYLSSVKCNGGLGYETTDLHFNVRGNGTVTYFGHLRFDLVDLDHTLGDAMLGGAVHRFSGSIVGHAVEGSIAGSRGGEDLRAARRANRVTVTDQAQEASRAFAERYRIIPNLVKALAADPPTPPDLSPPVLTRGDTVSTQVQTDGVRVTLIALVRPESRWLGVRLTHEVQQATFSACKGISLTIDGTSEVLPVAHRVNRVGAYLQEGLSAKLGVETFRRLTRGGDVVFDACGKRITLPKPAVASAAEVLSSFESRVTALGTPQSAAARADVPASNPDARVPSSSSDAGSMPAP